MQALDGIAQLDRVLSSSGGAALLCGRAGAGRKSALALVAYMHHMEVGHAPTAMVLSNVDERFVVLTRVWLSFRNEAHSS